jgi:hypothetical protein
MPGRDLGRSKNFIRRRRADVQSFLKSIQIEIIREKIRGRRAALIECFLREAKEVR